MIDTIRINIAGKNEEECYTRLKEYREIFGPKTNWEEKAGLEWTNGEDQDTHEPLKYLTVTFKYELSAK